MTQTVERREAAPETGPRRKRWTRQECERMEQIGLLSGRYELIDGEILDRMGQNPPHVFVLLVLLDWLRDLFGASYVRVEAPISLAGEDGQVSEPLPDLAVTRQVREAYRLHHPGPADVELVVEVSETTLNFDITTKAALYARAAISEYWVVDVTGARVIVHRQPEAGAYADVRAYTADEPVAPIGKPEAALVLRERVADEARD